MPFFPKEYALKGAIRENDIALVIRMLDEGADLAKVVDRNPRILADAVRKNHGAVLEACITCGQIDMGGVAVANALSELVRVERGPFRNAWPLAHASEKLLYWTQKFKNAGALFNGVDDQGRSFMHAMLEDYTARKTVMADLEYSNFLKVADILPPDYVGSLGKLDKKGRTVLHIVINFNDRDHRFDVFRHFVEQGADLTMLDGKGHSLIDACFAAGREQMASYIGRTLTQRKEKAREKELARERELLFPPAVSPVEKLPEITASVPVAQPRVATVEPAEPPPPVTYLTSEMLARPVQQVAENQGDASRRDESWVKVSDHQVAKVETIPVLGYRLTDIFNFQTGERLSLSRNLQTQVETRDSMSLSDVPPQLMAQAMDFYRSQGGEISPEALVIKTGGVRLMATTALPLLKKK